MATAGPARDPASSRGRGRRRLTDGNGDRPWRLFIAHPVPADVRRLLHAQLAGYREAHPDARWTAPGTWHLTLLFLGSVAQGDVGELGHLLDLVAQTRTPYEVLADLGGGRSQRGDGVGWLGVSTGGGTLIDVADELAARCPRDITQGPAPRRTPAAHLTIVRRADETVIEALRQRWHGPLQVHWTIDRMRLVRSHLERDGARYETLHEATL